MGQEKQFYKEKVELILRDLEDRLDLSRIETEQLYEDELGISDMHDLELMENDHEELTSLLQEMEDIGETAWDNFKMRFQALVDKFRMKYTFV